MIVTVNSYEGTTRYHVDAVGINETCAVLVANDGPLAFPFDEFILLRYDGGVVKGRQIPNQVRCRECGNDRDLLWIGAGIMCRECYDKL